MTTVKKKTQLLGSKQEAVGAEAQQEAAFSKHGLYQHQKLQRTLNHLLNK
jgi:hypothetical protein